MTIGEYIKNLKIEKDFSNKDLGDLAGIDPSYISLIENNKRKPSPAILEKIAPHLGTTYENLMKIAEYTKPDLTLNDTAQEGVILNLIKDLVSKKIITGPNNIPEDIKKLLFSFVELEVKIQCDSVEESDSE